MPQTSHESGEEHNCCGGDVTRASGNAMLVFMTEKSSSLPVAPSTDLAETLYPFEK